MDISIFIGKVFGIYFFVLGISMLINAQFKREVMHDLVKSHIAMIIIGAITLIIGSILVISHNIWMSGWQVLVTILSWLVFLNGLVRVLIPEQVMRLAQNMQENKGLFPIAGTIMIIIGAYLLVKTFGLL